ncbi:MAG: pseudouridine synthase [Brevinematia bacterium]
MLKRIISKSEEGQKIFKYLLRISDASKIFLHKLFRKRKILVNNSPISKDYIIKENDEIYSTELSELKKEKSIGKLPDIIYSDENILVIDKKSGELVYGENNSILDNIKNHKKYDFIVPVHRLDKYTEGLIIFALNYKTSVKLTELFRNNKVIKIYESLLHGNIEKQIFVEAEIIRTENISKVNNLTILENIPDKNDWLKNKKNKSATIIRPIKKSDKYTLCEIEIWTGHHHQIRAISSAINHPVAGDKKYKAKDNFKNYLLLCKKIEIPELNYYFETKKNLKINLQSKI